MSSQREENMGLLLSYFLTASMSLMALGADLSGRWDGNLEIKAPDGNTLNISVWTEFTQKDQQVEGRAGGGDSDESSPIEKVTFDGKNLSFEFASPDGRVYKANLALAGEDRLEGTLDFTLPDGAPMTARMTLKRGSRSGLVSPSIHSPGVLTGCSSTRNGASASLSGLDMCRT
jgi:hypothetical protein